MASAAAIDYAAAAMRANRTCYACGRTYTAEAAQGDPGWEPTKHGWRYGGLRSWSGRERSRRGRHRPR